MQGRAALLEGPPPVGEPAPSLLAATDCRGTEDRLADCRGAILGERVTTPGPRTVCSEGSLDLVCINSTDAGVTILSQRLCVGQHYVSKGDYDVERVA